MLIILNGCAAEGVSTTSSNLTGSNAPVMVDAGNGSGLVISDAGGTVGTTVGQAGSGASTVSIDRPPALADVLSVADTVEEVSIGAGSSFASNSPPYAFTTYMLNVASKLRGPPVTSITIRGGVIGNVTTLSHDYTEIDPAESYLMCFYRGALLKAYKIVGSDAWADGSAVPLSQVVVAIGQQTGEAQ